MEFERLLSFLEDTLANPLAEPSPLPRLHLELERARPAFLSLLDVAPKNAKERESLEKGEHRLQSWTRAGELTMRRAAGLFTFDGEQHRANQDFIDESLFLANTLNASESFCAALLRQGIAEQSRFGRPSAENGLLVFHHQRVALVKSLQAIWKGALSADPRITQSGLQNIFERETRELTNGKRAGFAGGNTQGWVGKVLAAIDTSQEQAAALRVSIVQPLPLQNALSFQAPGTTKPKISISDEAIEARIQLLDAERNALGQLLFLIATARQLSKSDILSLATWLTKTTLQDGAAIYLTIALLAALDPSDEGAAESLYPLYSDRNFIHSFHTLVNAKEWSIPSLRATITLQWTLFIVSAVHSLPNFEADTEIYEEHVEAMIAKAIEGGVWDFLGRKVLSYKWDAELSKIWGGVEGAEREVGGIAVEGWFQEYVTDQVEALVIGFVTSMTSVLRKLKNREEDILFSSHRGGQRASRGGQDERPTEIRHDLESLFLLIATIYRNSPDAGSKFWSDSPSSDPSTSALTPGTSRLSAFLRWGAECRAQGMLRAYYEMIASLATGPQCAAYAFEFLAANGGLEQNPGYQGTAASISWSTLFGALDFYSQNLPMRPTESGSNIEGVPGEIPPEEIMLLLSFVRVLRQVVAYSDVARATLYDNQRHRPIATLFNLLARPIRIELKASLLGALAAFSRPGGSFGVEVARRTWAALEQSQILPTMQSAGRGGMVRRGGMSGGGAGGILTELEEVEVPNQMFPGSTAFIDLLNSLVHTPDSTGPLRRGAEIDAQTIPDNLGLPYRAPGIDPYVHFVVEDMLLKIGERDYIDPNERWSINAKCLTFVEKCLVSYDLGSFLASAAIGGAKSTVALGQLVVHPGFDVLLRLLSGSKLLESIFTIINAGLDALNENAASTPLFSSCVLGCLRIVRRVLELQAPFLEVVLPSLAETKISLSQSKLNLIKSVVTLEQHLLYAGDIVVQIALFVSCETEDEIALLAIQILSIIADSPSFDVVDKFREGSRAKLNRLIGLLEASSETVRITQGFMRQLEGEVPESELEVGEWSGTMGGGGSIRTAIRSAILDLLLKHTQPSRVGPNVAHLLLGLDIHEIDDPNTPDSRITCLHIVLELLALNVPSSDDDDDYHVSLLSRHPSLSAQCYRLVRQLCLHEYTSDSLSRYLRNREKYFLLQSGAMPFKVPGATAGALGEVSYADGTKVVTSSLALCAVLQSQTWLLESLALELNVLASGNDRQRAIKLVGALLGTNESSNDEGGNFLVDGTALPRMLEVFYSFDFTWHDAIGTTEPRLRHFAELRFDSCLKIDSTGCQVYDFTSLFALLGAARKELQSRGALNTVEQQEEVKVETRMIVETLLVENHRREIASARHHALRAWRSVLDIALTKALPLLPTEGRHPLLLDLMIAILPPIAAQETDQVISELLSGAAVLLMTKLRDEGVRLTFVEVVDSAQSFLPERLHAILRAILQATLQPGVSLVVRGNLYATLLNYLQYSSRLASSSPSLARSLADDAHPTDDLLSLDGASTVGGTRRTRRNVLESGNLTILQSAIDRLLPVLCRDAASGHEVWRTVAFTTLDALVVAAEEGRATSRVLGILAKQGYLQNFVASLKDFEADLQEALKPDPGQSSSHHLRTETDLSFETAESLNALYIYEAQMSFLTRLASTTEGAQKLMGAELLGRLAECDYLGARPESSSADMGKSLRFLDGVWY